MTSLPRSVEGSNTEVATGSIPGAKRRRIPGKALLGLIPLVALLVWWQITGSASSVSFPPPSTWFKALRQLNDSGVLWPATKVTLEVFLVSLLIATIVGFVLGMLIGGYRTVDRALGPILDFFRSLPPPAIVPVAALILGPSLKMNITVVAIAIVWPIVLNTASAMRAVPLLRKDVARTLGLSRSEQLFKVVIPSLVPGLMTGVRIAVSISIVVTLVVDILGSGGGLGALIFERQEQFDAAAVWGLLLLIGVFGFVFNALMAGVERRALRNWPGAH